MAFIDFAFFTKVCDVGFDRACIEFNISIVEGIRHIESLENFLDFALFPPGEKPSLRNLTNKGKTFLKHAKDISSDFSDGIDEAKSKLTEISIKCDSVNGKSFIVPCLTGIIDRHREYNIDMITYDGVTYDDAFYSKADTTIIFRPMSCGEDAFFDRKWSVTIEQGLYASRKYIQEAGSYPKMVEDLAKHAILGCSDSFNKNVYKCTNWHLSEQYITYPIEPSIMISSQSVLTAAVESGLGIGPLALYHEKTDNADLFRVLPDISGPSLKLDFAVRKHIDDSQKECIDDIENGILDTIRNFDLEVSY